MGVGELILVLVASAFAGDFSAQEDPVQPAFDVHADDFPAAAGGPNALTAALQAALRTWNVQGEAAVEVRQGDAGAAGDQGGGDGRSTVDVGTGTGTAPYVVFPRDVGDDRSECDIRLLTSNDGGAVTWSTAAAGTSGAYDAERVLLQALGSCLGLAPAVADSVMTPLATGTDASARVLGSADPAALQAIYGPAAVVLTPWSHFVIYDPEGGLGTDGRGEPGEEVLFRVQVLNEGTPAYGVSGHASIVSAVADLTFVEADTVAQDIAPDAFGVFVFTFRIDDCTGPSDVSARVDLTDARGDTYPVDVEFPLQCGTGEDTGVEEPDPKCGCATGPGAGWLAAGLAALALRRRRA